MFNMSLPSAFRRQGLWNTCFLYASVAFNVILALCLTTDFGVAKFGLFSEHSCSSLNRCLCCSQILIIFLRACVWTSIYVASKSQILNTISGGERREMLIIDSVCVLGLYRRGLLSKYLNINGEKENQYLHPTEFLGTSEVLISAIQTMMPQRWPYFSKIACTRRFTTLLATCAAHRVTFPTSDSHQPATWFCPRPNQEDGKKGLRVAEKMLCMLLCKALSQENRNVKKLRNWGWRETVWMCPSSKKEQQSAAHGDSGAPRLCSLSSSPGNVMSLQMWRNNDRLIIDRFGWVLPLIPG